MASYPSYTPVPVSQLQIENDNIPFYLHDTLVYFELAYLHNSCKALKRLETFYFEWRQYFAICNSFVLANKLKDARKPLDPEQSKYIFAFLCQESKLLTELNAAASLIQRNFKRYQKKKQEKQKVKVAVKL